MGSTLVYTKQVAVVKIPKQILFKSIESPTFQINFMSLHSLLVPTPSSFLNLSMQGLTFLAKRGLFWVNMAETASVSRSSWLCWIAASSLCSLDFYQENKVHKRRTPLVFQWRPKNAAYLRSHTPQLRQWNSKNLPLTSSLRKTSWLSDLHTLHYIANRVLCIDPGCHERSPVPGVWLHSHIFPQRDSSFCNRYNCILKLSTQ